jgi:hypothetical protein
MLSHIIRKRIYYGIILGWLQVGKAKPGDLLDQIRMIGGLDNCDRQAYALYTEDNDMAMGVELGNLEKVVEDLVAEGRYGSKSEVLREGVRRGRQSTHHPTRRLAGRNGPTLAGGPPRKGL